jgi:hypothetical protein
MKARLHVVAVYTASSRANKPKIATTGEAHSGDCSGRWLIKYFFWWWSEDLFTESVVLKSPYVCSRVSFVCSDHIRPISFSDITSVERDNPP